MFLFKIFSFVWSVLFLYAVSFLSHHKPTQVHYSSDIFTTVSHVLTLDSFVLKHDRERDFAQLVMFNTNDSDSQTFFTACMNVFDFSMTFTDRFKTVFKLKRLGNGRKGSKTFMPTLKPEHRNALEPIAEKKITGRLRLRFKS